MGNKTNKLLKLSRGLLLIFLFIFAFSIVFISASNDKVAEAAPATAAVISFDGVGKNNSQRTRVWGNLSISKITAGNKEFVNTAGNITINIGKDGGYSLNNILSVKLTVKVKNVTTNNSTTLKDDVTVIERYGGSYSSSYTYSLPNNYTEGNQYTITMSVRLLLGNSQTQQYTTGDQSYSFYYDWTTPDVTYSKSSADDGKIYSNSAVTATLYDTSPEGIYVSTNGGTYTRETTATTYTLNPTAGAVTTYSVYGKDYMGLESSKKTIILDKVVPTMVVKANGSTVASSPFQYVKGDIKVTASDTTQLYKLVYGSTTEWPSGTSQTITLDTSSLSQTSLNILLLYDLAGNTASFFFYYDTVFPQIQLYEDNVLVNTLGNGSTYTPYLNGTIKLSVIDENLELLTVNGNTVNDGSNISTSYLTQGKNTVVATDKSGNVSTAYFYYDDVAPFATMKKANGETVSWDSFCNQYVSFDIQDGKSGIYSAIIENAGNSSETYNWLTYTVGGTLYYYTKDGAATSTLFRTKSAAKEYVIEQRKDAVVYNSNGYNASFDSNLLAGEFPYAVADCAYYNYTNKSGTTVYAIRIATIYEYINNEYENWIGSFTATKALFEHEGEWLLKIIDNAGNSTTYNFKIDITHPSLTVQKNSLDIINGTHFKQGDVIKFAASDSNFSNIKINGADGSIVSSSAEFTLEIGDKNCKWLQYGENTIYVYDTFGNETTFVFYYDDVLPTLSAYKGTTEIDKDDNNVFITAYFKKGTTLKIHVAEDYVEYLTINGTTIKNSAGYISFNLDETNQTWLIEGTNTVLCSDRAGNTSSFTFVYDKTAPTGTLTGVTNGGKTNSNVSFSWTDVGSTATLNGSTYTSGTAISVSGNYTIILTDRAGNTTTYSFTIDKTAPTGTLSGVIDGGITNSNVSFSWSETTATAKLNGSNYTKGTTITNEGTYSIVLTDDVGNNSSPYTFTIDKTAPAFTLSGVTNGGITNGNVTLTWTETTATLTVNGSTPAGITGSSTKSYIVSIAENSQSNFTTKLTDRAGNVTTYTFKIDKLLPLIIMEKADGNSISWGQTSNQYVTFTATDTEGSIVSVIINKTGTDTTFDWSSFTANNTTLYYYKPEGSSTTNLYGSISKAKSYVLQQRLETVSSQPLHGYEAVMDANLHSSDNGYAVLGCDYYAYTNAAGVTNYFIRYSSLYDYIESDYDDWISSFVSNKTLFTEEGAFTISATDAAGNVTTQSFSIDTIAPTGTLSGVANNGITNTNVTFSWSEGGCAAILDGNSYVKGATIAGEGSHVIRLRDTVGNSTTYTFTIDKTAPIGTLEGVTDGGRTKDSVSLNWSEAGITVTLDANPYTKKTNISTDGFHTFELTDVAGNSKTYTFTIDTSAPTGTLSGVIDGGITNSNVSFSWDADNWTATLDTNNYIKGTAIAVEGTHTIVLTNDVGTSHTYTFEIDKTAPTGTLTGVTNGGVTNTGVSFSWTGTNTCTENGNNYVKNATITGEGAHTIILTDVAGNTTTYTFTIRTTAPVVQFSATATTVDGNNYYYNKNVSISWEEADVTATINGAAYTKASLISEEGNYTIVLTDEPGNKATVVVIMDKTAYSLNYNKFVQNYANHNNHWYETFVYALSDNKYIRQSYWSFTNNTDALTFATMRENSIVEFYDTFSIGTTPYCNWAGRAVDGFDVADQTSINGYPYYIYYDKNDSNKLTAYFNYSNLQAAINKYATASISEKYIPSTPATAYIGDGTVPAQSLYRNYVFIKGTTASFNYKPTDITLTINGHAANYVDGLSLGVNNIKEVDRAGNALEYVVILDNEAPVVLAKDFSGNTIDNIQSQFVSQTTIYAAEQFRMMLDDEYDNQALMTITFGETTTNVINGSYEFTESGTYTVKIRDLAGNNKTYTVYLSLQQPNINIAEHLSVQSVLIGFTAEIDKVLDINTLMSIRVSTWDAVSEVWIDLSADDNSTEISISTLSYYFATTNLYKITVLDSYGRETSITYNFIKDSPTGRVLTSTGLQLKDGAETQLSVKFVWDDNTSLAYLNELEYTKGVIITDEGKYTIKLVSTGGETTFYNFKIDRTAPTGTLTGVNANNYSNTSVTMTWSAETESSTVGYIKTASDVDFYPYTKDTAIVEDNAYSIKLIDGAGNSKVYNFEIKKTPPLVKIVTATGKELSNAGLTNQTCYFTWTEVGCTATIKNSTVNEEVSYTKNTNVYTTATYSLYITDKFGNTAYYSITIDKVPPVINASGLQEGNAYTKENVSFSWTENNVTVLLNESTYEKDTVITGEGQYVLVGKDVAGNATTYTFTIDKTAPTGTLTGTGNLVDGTYYIRSSSQFNWKESGCTATLNGAPYEKTTIIKEEGAYSIVLTDAAGNSTTYNMVIDFEAPEASIIGNYNLVNNEYYFKENASLDWEDATATATINGIAYTKLSAIEDEGVYSIAVKDRAGNTTSYTFIIDKTAPILVFSTSYNRANEKYYFKAGFSASWAESGCTTTLNEAAYAKNTAVTTEGEYTFVVTDRAGNVTRLEAILDKTAPEGTFLTTYLLKSGIYYFTTNTSFDSNEENIAFTLDGVVYEKASTIEDAGSHLMIITDVAGNNREYEFIIDKTAPIGEFNIVGNIYDGITYFKYSTTFTWSESSLTATLDGNAYTKGTTIAAEGAHSLKLFDKAENETEYRFVIDKTAPEATASVAGNIVDNISYYKTDITLIWTDVEVVSASLNGQNYIMESTISEENSFVFELTDRAGNTKTYNFVIDKTSPEGELSGTFYGPENYSNNNVRFSWTEDGCSATLNGEKYIKNAFINKQGTHNIVLTDNAGNSTTYTFIISTTHPLGILEGVTDGGKTSGAVSFSWTELNYSCMLSGESYDSGAEITTEGQHTIILTGPNAMSTTYTFTIDKTAPEGTLSGVTNNGRTNSTVTFSWRESGCTATLNGNSYSKGGNVVTEGVHSIILTDDVGNSTTYTFTIDKTAPTGTLTGVTNNGRTNTDVRFNWTEDKCVADLNGVSYTKNTTISSEGVYSIVLTDDVGNSTTYTFEIDKTAPTGTLTGVTNGGITNGNVSFSWIGTKITVKLNDEIYSKGTNIFADGNHTITITDDVGNTTTYTFEIKKNAPIGTLNGVDNGSITNADVSFYWYEEGATATLNDESYNVGTLIVTEGEYSIILTDRAGNNVTYTFTIDKTAPTGTLDGVANDGKTNTDVSFSWTETTATATVNENEYKKNTVLSNEGDYLIILTDVAGNTTEYRFTIDKTAPLFNYTNTIVRIDNNINYFSEALSMVWSDDNCTATLNDEAYENGTTIEADGNYTFVLTDDLGNARTFVFIIDKTSPMGTLEGVINNGRTKENVSFSWTDNRATATLNAEKYTSGTAITKEGVYSIVLTDDVGNSTTYSFTIDKTAPTGTLTGVTNGGATNGEVVFVYDTEMSDYAYIYIENMSEEDIVALEATTTFTEEGNFIIIVRDDVGNSTTYSFEINRTAPIGTLSGINSNNISNRSVSFSWTEVGCTATLNGAEYSKNTFVSLEGDYTIILKNALGTTTEYHFEIDKTAPTGTLDGINEYGTTNSAAKLSWTEDGCFATLNGAPYVSGTELTGEGNYAIELTDRAGNSTTYTFTIDKTVPTASFSSEYKETDGIWYFSGSTVITWKDKSIAKCNDVEITTNSYLPKDTNLTIVLTDRAGNSTEYKVFIYSSMPIISVNITKTDGTTKDVELQNGKSYTFTNMEIEPSDEYEIYLNDSKVTEKVTFATGENTLKIVNKAGTESVISITISEVVEEEQRGKVVNTILIIIGILIALTLATFLIKNTTKRGLKIKRI